MFESCCPQRRIFFLGTGLGAMLGIGLLVGAFITTTYWAGFETPIEAVATSGAETMAIATGPVVEGVEGLFILDFLTGDLTCQVLHPRTGQLGGIYRCNVAQDLGTAQGKSPKYLLVTGYLNARQNIGNVKPGESLVYVADVNTGRYVAYMLPWNKLAAANYQAQAYRMIPVGGGSARNITVEE